MCVGGGGGSEGVTTQREEVNRKWSRGKDRRHCKVEKNNLSSFESRKVGEIFN